MKTYQVFLKPCAEYPEGSLCIDPSYIHQDKEDKDGYAVFYKKKNAQKLVDYLCSLTWEAYSGVPSNKPEDYEIVCSHDVWYCVFDYADKEGRVDMFFNTKKEAKDVLKLCQADCPESKDDFVVAELLIPKKKVS